MREKEEGKRNRSEGNRGAKRQRSEIDRGAKEREQQVRQRSDRE